MGIVGFHPVGETDPRRVTLLNFLSRCIATRNNPLRIPQNVNRTLQNPLPFLSIGEGRIVPSL